MPINKIGRRRKPIKSDLLTPEIQNVENIKYILMTKYILQRSSLAMMQDYCFATQNYITVKENEVENVDSICNL